ncbi:MAG TPA: site-specific integrase [Acidimicrobiales bacterium]|nr:site-specific integrase [Acidimicrobiales bacterium]
MAKRQFGSVRRLPSGHWQARYRDPANGRLLSAPQTFTTKANASLWLSVVEADLARGCFVDPKAGDVSVREYAEHWLDHRVLRPRTVELYRGLLDRYVLPSLGEVQLGKLTPLTVRGWHSRMAKAGKPGPITIAKAYRLLKTICSTAVADELLVRNPCNVKGAAVERSKERPVLSVAQIDALVGSIDPRYKGMVLLGSWCGLRLGELLALTRGDIDLVNGLIYVTKSAAELKSGERVVGPPKTAAGIRKVAIPPHVLPAVEAHLDEFTGPDSADLVFVGTKGQAVRRASLYTAWLAAVNGAGLEGTHFHDLRHTGATLAAMTGASTKELMSRLGHASPVAALRYQHATENRDVAIAEALSELAIGTSNAKIDGAAKEISRFPKPE